MLKRIITGIQAFGISYQASSFVRIRKRLPDVLWVSTQIHLEMFLDGHAGIIMTRLGNKTQMLQAHGR